MILYNLFPVDAALGLFLTEESKMLLNSAMMDTIKLKLVIAQETFGWITLARFCSPFDCYVLQANRLRQSHCCLLTY